MIKLLIARLVNADRARSNALHASRVISDERREREEVDAYLASLDPFQTMRPGVA